MAGSSGGASTTCRNALHEAAELLPVVARPKPLQMCESTKRPSVWPQTLGLPRPSSFSRYISAANSQVRFRSHGLFALPFRCVEPTIRRLDRVRVDELAVHDVVGPLQKLGVLRRVDVFDPLVRHLEDGV